MAARDGVIYFGSAVLVGLRILSKSKSSGLARPADWQRGCLPKLEYVLFHSDDVVGADTRHRGRNPSRTGICEVNPLVSSTGGSVNGGRSRPGRWRKASGSDFFHFKVTGSTGTRISKWSVVLFLGDPHHCFFLHTSLPPFHDRRWPILAYQVVG
jgi:hypothetical protein